MRYFRFVNLPIDILDQEIFRAVMANNDLQVANRTTSEVEGK